MQFMRRTLAILVVVSALVAVPLFAQEGITIDKLQRSADELADSLASALPFNSTAGLNWSDAYIGQLIGLPPHLGIGLVAGATAVDSEDVAAVLSDLGYEEVGDLPDQLPIPAAAVEGRIGGFILPFDLGFKIGFIPQSVGDALADSGSGLGVDYFLFGIDARYAVYKGSFWLPKISAGIGFNYLRGGVSATVNEGQEFTFEDPVTNVDHTIEVTDPEVGLEWSTRVIDFKVQASKKFLIFTPYLGFGLSHGSSRAGYFIDSKIKYDDAELTDAQLTQLLDDLEAYNEALELIGKGFDIPDISSTGIESSVNVSGWATRAFGGFSINLLWIYFDITGLYNFSDGSYGGTFGARFQL